MKEEKGSKKKKIYITNLIKPANLFIWLLCVLPRPAEVRGEERKKGEVGLGGVGQGLG